MSVKGTLWLTRCTSRTFLEGRMAGERWKSNKVGFVVVGLPSWINLDNVAPSEYKSGVFVVHRMDRGSCGYELD